MQVILISDVPHVGNMGQVVNVSDGYGRNYLIPQRLAVQATAGNKRHFEHLKQQIKVRSDKLREAAMAAHGTLHGISVTLPRKTGVADKLYGSVTNRDIGEALAAAGHDVDRRTILLDQPIRELGIYEVPIKLHSDVSARVRVWVVKM